MMSVRQQKRWLSALTACVFSGLSLAQEPPIDADAAKAFESMVLAYRSRPGLAVTTKVTIDLAAEGTTATSTAQEAKFVFGQNRTGIVMLRGFTCLLAAGKFTVTHEQSPHSYYSIDDQSAPYYVLLTAFVDMPFPELAIVFGETEMEDLYMQFHPKAPNVVPAGVSEVVLDGKNYRRIELAAPGERVEIVLDPKTQLMQSVIATITTGPYVQSGTTLSYRHAYEYEVHDVPLDPKTFAFDAGKRQRVDHLATLLPKREATPLGDDEDEKALELVGLPSPALILEALNGDVIDLADFAGKVVVLDFWATWCGPCRRGLPLLHEVALWATEAKLPVAVLTVNCWEQDASGDRSPDARRRAAGEFWVAQKFTLPVLMDYSDATARDFGVRGIPMTVIIRSDGTVHEVHTGVDSNSAAYVRKLKAGIQQALGAPEAS